MDGGLVYTYVLKEDFESTGAAPSDTEDVINQTLTISGTKAAVIFVEQMKGGFKLSFRSRCSMNCNEVAKHFNGGGHKAAAGAFQDGAFSDVCDKVLPVVREYLTAALKADKGTRYGAVTAQACYGLPDALRTHHRSISREYTAKTLSKVSASI